VHNDVTNIEIQAGVVDALTEDIGTGDLTAALIPADESAAARVIARQPTVLCGVLWFDEVFRQLDSRVVVTWHCAEGEAVDSNRCVCSLEGPARALLSGERTALNFLQTLSGTAMAAREYVQAIASTGAQILDTRKTIPGLRFAQKYAVRVGGGSNHRIGLFDAVLIKENHIAAAGSIEAAVAQAARRIEHSMMLEVEVESLEQLAQALRTSATRIMLDNFDTDQMRKAVALRDATAPRIELEASGGITLANVREIAATGVDVISVGAITKDLRAADYSMRFD